MSRFSRILITDKASKLASVAAPPPEAVALESDFVIILAVLLCALICVVGLIAVARCAWRRRSSSATNGQHSQRSSSSPTSSSSANKGLKKKVLQSLPKLTYTSTAAATSSQETTNGTRNSVELALAQLSSECAICLGEFVEGDEIRVLPQCGHGFHVACIDRWLGSHSSCPSCRQILVVGRCQKCGQFPAVSLSAAGAGTQSNTESDRPAAPINNDFLPEIK